MRWKEREGRKGEGNVESMMEGAGREKGEKMKRVGNKGRGGR